MLTFTIGLLCVSAVYSQHNHHHHADNTTKKINNVIVDVYYESLCPDSIAFITKQLYPALSTDLANHINLTLYPYGKSKTTKNGENYTFNCHHGANECDGNRYHACALTLINDGKPTESLGYNKDSVNYVNCLLKTVKEKTVLHDACVSDAKDYAAQIKTCATGKQGDEFLAKYGESTDKFQNPLKSVPSIVFNGEQSKDAEQNFRRELCKKFGDAKPAICSKSGAYSTKAAFGILTIVVAIFFM